MRHDVLLQELLGALAGVSPVVEAQYKGRSVKLNKPMRGDVKKFKVYVKDPTNGKYMIKLKSLLNEVDYTRNAVSKEEARNVYKKLNYNFDFKQFFVGMNVELEHMDITNGDLIKTAKIVAAHLNEVPKYYTLLKKYVEK